MSRPKPSLPSILLLRAASPATLLAALLTALALLPAAASAQQEQEDLNVFTRWRQYSNAGQALYDRIVDEALELAARRDRQLAALAGEAQWKAYREQARGRLAQAFGPLPERTALKARVTGSFEREGFRVEKILFESRPGFLVTAAFFKRADARGRLPVVVYLCGHSAEGFRSEIYQRIILNLASKGIAVLAVDPIGQGERLQYLDPDSGRSAVGGPTAEHSYPAPQYLLLGRSMAMVRLWDAIRAVDYLATRPDVDMRRIGVQGRSGGGTMSAYLGAMDERILAAAPECYLTSYSRLLQSIGPQDAEQCLLSQLALGLDHGDFLLARAPRPTLVVTTSRDYFSLQGARETVAAARPGFAALGSPEGLRLVTDDAPHMSTPANRERVYAFFLRAFGLTAADSLDRDLGPWDQALLRVSATGQVAAEGSRTIHDLIVEDSRPVLRALAERRREPGDHHALLAAARRLSGTVMEQPAPSGVIAGRYCRQDCTVEKYILEAPGKIPLPALLLRPEGPGPFPALLWLDPAGKGREAAPGALLEQAVRRGWLVLALDLPGRGELAPATEGDDAVIGGESYNYLFGAQLIGRSVTGIQAEAVQRAVSWLAGREDVDRRRIAAAARGAAGPALLHAAALGEGIFAVAELEGLLSWASLLEHRYYDQRQGVAVVPGALACYDLPDLRGALERPLLLACPRRGDGSPWTAGEHSELRVGSAAPLTVLAGEGPGAPEALLHWLEELP